MIIIHCTLAIILIGFNSAVICMIRHQKSFIWALWLRQYVINGMWMFALAYRFCNKSQFWHMRKLLCISFLRKFSNQKIQMANFKQTQYIFTRIVRDELLVTPIQSGMPIIEKPQAMPWHDFHFQDILFDLNCDPSIQSDDFKTELHHDVIRFMNSGDHL